MTIGGCEPRGAGHTNGAPQIRSPPPDFLLGVAASVNNMWFSLRRTTSVAACEIGEVGNPGTLGMTKRRGLLKGKGPLPKDTAVVGRRGRLSIDNTHFHDSNRFSEKAKKSQALSMPPSCHTDGLSSVITMRNDSEGM